MRPQQLLQEMAEGETGYLRTLVWLLQAGSQVVFLGMLIGIVF